MRWRKGKIASIDPGSPRDSPDILVDKLYAIVSS